jgi:hypothetical protein
MQNETSSVKRVSKIYWYLSIFIQDRGPHGQVFVRGVEVDQSRRIDPADDLDELLEPLAVLFGVRCWGWSGFF